MAHFDWSTFLRHWSGEILASPLGKDVPTSARAEGWLGFPPATEDQIILVEGRLEIALPPSYQAFLRTSNGWLRTTHAIDRLLDVEQLDWFRKRHRQWISAFTKPTAFEPREKTPDNEYFAYGPLAEEFRPEHLRAALQISAVGDAAVYLLNPQVINKYGEWEAWFFANWLPGVHRYRSFEEMMQAEYHQFSHGDRRQPEGVVGELPDEYIGQPGSPKRRVKKRTRPRVRKVLGKAFDRWTVDELLEMLRNPDFDIIHNEVVTGLELLGDERAVQPLIEMIERDQNVSAMSALKRLAPQFLPALLLEVLRESTGPGFHRAAIIMAELNDDRAVPLLVKTMGDTGPLAKPDAEWASTLIKSFGTPGYNALVASFSHANPVVRRRALQGLRYTDRSEARQAIEPLLMDSDESVRDTARGVLDQIRAPL